MRKSQKYVGDCKCGDWGVEGDQAPPEGESCAGNAMFRGHSLFMGNVPSVEWLKTRGGC